MENRFSLCSYIFINEAVDVNFSRACIDAQEKGEQKSVLYSSGLILMLGFLSNRTFVCEKLGIHHNLHFSSFM